MIARSIAAVGDAGSPGTWSGIPHFLYEAGRRSEFFSGALNLDIGNIVRKRAVWQLGRALKGEKPRGYQYGRSFSAELGRKVIDETARLGVSEVVSHWQLLPATEHLQPRGVRTSFYIDTTLQDLFESNGMLAWLNPSVVREAIEREKAEYHAAWRVVTMARWARESLTGIYGLPTEKIYTVLAGANLPENRVIERLGRRGPMLTPEHFTRERPMRIGFTGKDWKRKGLRRLVEAAEALERMGIPVEVLVVGFLPKAYQDHPRVRHAGFLDKDIAIERFMDLLESCDFGCSPSHEEPMGIAPLEYLRLGIPVVCTTTGGLIDVCEAAGEAALAVPKEVTGAELAERLSVVARDSSKRDQMNRAAWARKDHFRWDRTVDELRKAWAEQCVSS